MIVNPYFCDETSFRLLCRWLWTAIEIIAIVFIFYWIATTGRRYVK